MIHEISPSILDNAYKSVDIDAGSRMAIFLGHKILLKETAQGIAYPCYADVKEHIENYRYLFSMNGQSYFLGTLKEGHEKVLSAYKSYSSDEIKECQPVELAFAAMTAMHLDGWYKNSGYCGRCGHETRHHPSMRMMQCPSCGNMIFPRISPCVICAVTDGERLLVTQHAPGHGYALVAGFMEIGETAEECCAREVFEETGVHITDVRYYASQPWGCDGNMMFGYTARLDGSHHIELDQNELSSARWLKPEEIPEPEDKSSLTREMIRRFRKGQLF